MRIHSLIVFMLFLMLLTGCASSSNTAGSSAQDATALNEMVPASVTDDLEDSVSMEDVSDVFVGFPVPFPQNGTIVALDLENTVNQNLQKVVVMSFLLKDFDTVTMFYDDWLAVSQEYGFTRLDTGDAKTSRSVLYLGSQAPTGQLIPLIALSETDSATIVSVTLSDAASEVPG